MITQFTICRMNIREVGIEEGDHLGDSYVVQSRDDISLVWGFESQWRWENQDSIGIGMLRELAKTSFLFGCRTYEKRNQGRLAGFCFEQLSRWYYHLLKWGARLWEGVHSRDWDFCLGHVSIEFLWNIHVGMSSKMSDIWAWGCRGKSFIKHAHFSVTDNEVRMRSSKNSV